MHYYRIDYEYLTSKRKEISTKKNVRKIMEQRGGKTQENEKRERKRGLLVTRWMEGR